MIVVWGPTDIDDTELNIIPRIVTKTIIMSNIFQPSIKNLCPYPIILITNSSEKITVNNMFMLSIVVIILSDYPYHDNESMTVLTTMQKNMKF
jgi:hypothetical protein